MTSRRPLPLGDPAPAVARRAGRMGAYLVRLTGPSGDPCYHSPVILRRRVRTGRPRKTTAPGAVERRARRESESTRATGTNVGADPSGHYGTLRPAEQFALLAERRRAASKPAREISRFAAPWPRYAAPPCEHP